MFRRRKRPPWDDPKVLREMLLDLHRFICSELDPEPHPLDAYFGDRDHCMTARVIARAASREQVQFGGPGQQP